MRSILGLACVDDDLDLDGHQVTILGFVWAIEKACLDGLGLLAEYFALLGGLPPGFIRFRAC